MILFLIVCVICMACGFCAGIAVTATFMVITGGSPDASKDRNDLIEVLTSEFAIEERAAVRILGKGLNQWSQWRAKTRPVLWSLGLDWPEYTPTRPVEFSTHYERGLEKPSESSTESDSELSEDYHGALLQPNLEPETISATMPDNSDDSY
jgi:hypothetical protein